jgi:hypothetical protein
MADGRQIPSAGVWKGRVTVKGISREGTFEVFKSNGAWAMLFGKPLLKRFNAVHDYTEDTIRIPQEKGSEWVTLENQFTNAQGATGKLLANGTADIKQLIVVTHDEPDPPTNGSSAKPMRTKETKTAEGNNNPKTYKLRGGFTNPLEGSTRIISRDITEPCITDVVVSAEENVPEQSTNIPDDTWKSVWLLDEAAGNSSAHPGMEQPDVAKVFEPTLLTRKTDPKNPERVKAILSEITIGEGPHPGSTNTNRGADI